MVQLAIPDLVVPVTQTPATNGLVGDGLLVPPAISEPRPAPVPAEPTPPTTPPATVPPAVLSPEAARLRELESKLAQYQEREADAALAQRVGDYRKQLEANGWPPELAEFHSKTWGEREQLKSQLESATAAQVARDKFQVAERISTHFGVPIEALAGATSPQEMVLTANRLSESSKRLAALEAEVKALRGGTVPAQSFDTGRGSPLASDAAFLTQYSAGQSQDHARAKKLLGI